MSETFTYTDKSSVISKAHLCKERDRPIQGEEELLNNDNVSKADLVKETLKDPEEMKLMIGTRTINERSLKDKFTEETSETIPGVNHATQKLTK